jgi:hypothetical protein
MVLKFLTLMVNRRISKIRTRSLLASPSMFLVIKQMSSTLYFQIKIK